MDYGESLDETAIREAREEIGCEIQIDYLIGVYSRFFVTCSNGDQLQAVTALFGASVVGGQMRTDDVETFGLGYFSQKELPEIDTHQLVFIEDYFSGKRGVWR